jgi:hypothetical protein
LQDRAALIRCEAPPAPGLISGQVCGPKPQSVRLALLDRHALFDVRGPHPSGASAHLVGILADAQDGAIVRGLVGPDGDVICLTGGAVFVVDP